ncbi:MAG: carbohydrate ABC transporter permease [Clostridia bacterium]|nr:carbohydrate ABC transporter permease [Clostridia bacterium]
MTKKSLKNLPYYIFLTAVLFITILPILYTVLASFKSNSEILTSPESLFPKKFTLDNYITALNSESFNVPRMLWNSIYYTVCCVTINMLTSSTAGYVFARGNFPGQKALFAVFSSLMFISLGSITIYPQFEVLDTVGLSGNLWGLIVMKIFGIGIVNIYLVRSYVRTLPAALEESAYIDGCSFIRAFFSIILPLLKPIMATIGILSFQASWNDYLMPTLFTLTRPEQRTLIVGVAALKSSSEAASSWNLMLAGSTIALIPVLFAYGVANKHFVKGLASGAVKG